MVKVRGVGGWKKGAGEGVFRGGGGRKLRGKPRDEQCISQHGNKLSPK